MRFASLVRRAEQRKQGNNDTLWKKNSNIILNFVKIYRERLCLLRLENGTVSSTTYSIETENLIHRFMAPFFCDDCEIFQKDNTPYYYGHNFTNMISLLPWPQNYRDYNSTEILQNLLDQSVRSAKALKRHSKPLKYSLLISLDQKLHCVG